MAEAVCGAMFCYAEVEFDERCSDRLDGIYQGCLATFTRICNHVKVDVVRTSIFVMILDAYAKYFQ
jgi:hypothetical protein